VFCAGGAVEGVGVGVGEGVSFVGFCLFVGAGGEWKWVRGGRGL